MACECGCTKECLKEVFLLSVEEDFEGFGLCDSTKLGLSVVWAEVVMIVGDVGKYVE